MYALNPVKVAQAHAWAAFVDSGHTKVKAESKMWYRDKSAISRLKATLALLVVTAVAAFAQNVNAPSAGAGNVDSISSDYVTLGSRVPYYVPVDPVIYTMTTVGTMKPSIFRWFITTSSDALIAGIPLLEFDGTPGQEYDDFRNVAAGTGYYDNEISVAWTAANGFAAGTQYKIKVAEKSVTQSPVIAGCDGNTQEKSVYVLAPPTVAFAGAQGGGCTVSPGTTFEVPLTVTGLGDWQVTYTVSYNGGAASAPVVATLTLAAPVVTDATVIAASVLARNTATGEGLLVNLPAAQYGYYDITITNITDRTSRKSMDALALSAAAGTFRIYVSPVPGTLQIKHVKNL